MSFVESEERRALRAAVAELGAKYGASYYVEKAKAGQKTDELWAEAGRLGYLGVNVPEEYGGGGGGIGDLAAVCEAGRGRRPLLLMVVSPAICATIIARSGTDEQREHWLPRFADGSVKMAFAITEPDAGSNSHRITTTARRDGDGWVLNGRRRSSPAWTSRTPSCSSPAPRTRRATCAPPVHRPDGHARLHLHAHRHGDRVAGEAVHLPPRRRPAAL